LIDQEGGFYHNFRPLQREYNEPAEGKILTMYRPKQARNDLLCFDRFYIF